MSSKWSKAPIFYMIAQVRFGAVLTMGDFVSGIQEVLRRDFPDFSMQPLHRFEFQLASSGSTPEPKSTLSSRWHFKNVSTTAGYMLAADSLTFHTTDYSTSEDFIGLLLRGLEVVNDQVGLSYIEGLGMRSLDAVVPELEQTLDFYVKPNLLGLYGKMEGDFRHSIFEAVFQKSAGQLTSRAVTLRGRLGVSADLVPMTLQIRADLLNLEGVHIVLDNDCMQQERISFDIDEIARRLKNLKRAISEAFTESVTQEATAFWRGDFS
jgi:uncharacterized protein (TIGR04255 family)